MRSLPVARWSPLAGRIVADTVKQAWSLTLLLGVGMILGFRLGNGLFGLLAAFALLLVFSLAAAWMSVLVGVLVSEPDKVQIFGFTVIFPLSFTSNAFVPTETMPSWLQHWVEVNPVTILANALRGLLVGGPVAGRCSSRCSGRSSSPPSSPRSRCGACAVGCDPAPSAGARRRVTGGDPGAVAGGHEAVIPGQPRPGHRR